MKRISAASIVALMLVLLALPMGQIALADTMAKATDAPMATEAPMATDVMTFEGILVDQNCAIVNKGMALDGVDVNKNPQDHHVGCILEPMCVKSGMGIYVQNADMMGYTYYKLDMAGSEMAVEVAKSTMAKTGLKVTVMGKLDGDMITVSSIMETPAMETTAMAATFEGILVDQNCAIVNKGMALDGVDVNKNPQDHHVGCILEPMCVKSGMGIYVQNADMMGYTYYKLDMAGSEMAVEVAKMTKMKTGLKVTVMGTMDGDMITVTSIMETPAMETTAK